MLDWDFTKAYSHESSVRDLSNETSTSTFRLHRHHFDVPLARCERHRISVICKCCSILKCQEHVQEVVAAGIAGLAGSKALIATFVTMCAIAQHRPPTMSKSLLFNLFFHTQTLVFTRADRSPSALSLRHKKTCSRYFSPVWRNASQSTA